MAMLNTRMKVGRRIRSLREGRGLNQTTFAHSIGITQPYLARIETGVGNITIDSLMRIATGLDTPLASFFDDEMFKTLENVEGVLVLTPKSRKAAPDQLVLETLRDDPSATINTIAYRTNLGTATVVRALGRLKEAGEIVRVGAPRTGHWELVHKA